MGEGNRRSRRHSPNRPYGAFWCCSRAEMDESLNSIQRATVGVRASWILVCGCDCYRSICSCLVIACPLAQYRSMYDRSS